MDEYAGRVLADRYRLPSMPVGEEPFETPAFDTYSGQEVLAHQVRLPEVVSAEVVFGVAEGEDPPDVLGPEDDPGQRALRAARAAAGIPDHPRLVQVYDVFLDGGSLWTISEWVSARPLSELIADRTLSPYRAAEIGADVLTALRAVHAHAWTHRNVTSETVLIADDGRAILTGLATGAAEEAICGIDPVPATAGDAAGDTAGEEHAPEPQHAADGRGGAFPQPGPPTGPGPFGPRTEEPYTPQDPYGAAPDELDGLPVRKPVHSHVIERSREVRLDLIGAVTERWAPEQAGPVPLKLPGLEGLPDWGEPVEDAGEDLEVGPPADLWALGALLFRAIQGHPPFPEDDPRQLVEVVCTEPPAFAEECGPLRPIVESLLRKDPRTRPDPEEVRGWLRSLIRTAPEPDIGRETVSVPADEPHKVVEIRRRGDVARRNRRGEVAQHGKHARARGRKRGPRRLGMLLVGLVLLLVALALVVAALLLPRLADGEDARDGGSSSQDSGSQDSGSGAASRDDAPPPQPEGDESSSPDLSTDTELYRDPQGFQLQIQRDLVRKGNTKQGQVLFSDGDDVDMIIVPGRDTAEKFGDDLATYQIDKEPELSPYRDADWGSTGSVERLTLNGQRAIQGEFSWRDDDNREYYARNLVVLHDGKYHVLLVQGPERDRSEVSRFFEKSAASYRVTE